ncbi:MAG: hypothetical protein AB1772_06960, partial [Candidatus Zixiibacteriota bacterium]
MKPSPLAFARSFEQLRGRLESQPAADLRLLQLADFWPSLSQFHDDPSYRNYFDEFSSLLEHDISECAIIDLLPNELRQLLNIALEVSSIATASHVPGSGVGRVPAPAEAPGEKPDTDTPDLKRARSSSVGHPSADLQHSESARQMPSSADLRDAPHIHLLALEAARKFFYVGATDDALACLYSV